MTRRIVIMGVSGCGKSSVGAALAGRLGIPYRDGDDLHPAANVDRMRAGIALTDADRWPWLDRVAQVLAEEAPVIVGCSALRRVYRDRIRAGAGGPVRFVHLAGSRAVIAARMAARTGHYMPLALLDSQFATLEPPGAEEAVTVDIDRPLGLLVRDILESLDGGGR
ncbi:MAG: gluconate kinase [Rhodobacter sp. CACIA14H1]|nr:MAG: gluconate kinase [Rhodobacter sp. CACIA14H1]